MIRLAVSVEGETEEDFVNGALASRLQRHGVYATPILLGRARYVLWEALEDVPLTELAAIRSEFPTPEDINDDPATAPSKRIGRLIPHYRKRLHGPLIADEIGVDTIRNECARFDVWLRRLESLGELRT